MAKAGPLILTMQLACGTELALDPDKAELLKAIDKVGSISAGARAVGMSYKRAWILVDGMNRCWAEPLVVTSIGGPKQGTQVTAFGRQILAACRALEERVLRSTTGDALETLTNSLLSEPRPRTWGKTP